MSDATFLETILCNITTESDRALAVRSEDEHGILFKIKVSKIDMPRIIGKQGQNINAIRLLMKLYAKDGPNISIVVEEPA